MVEFPLNGLPFDSATVARSASISNCFRCWSRALGWCWIVDGLVWIITHQPSQTSSIHINIYQHISTISIRHSSHIHPIFIPSSQCFSVVHEQESAVDTFRWWDRLGRCRSPSLCTGIQISIVTKLCGLHWTRWRVGSQKVAHGCTIMLYTMVSHLRFG